MARAHEQLPPQPSREETQTDRQPSSTALQDAGQHPWPPPTRGQQQCPTTPPGPAQRPWKVRPLQVETHWQQPARGEGNGRVPHLT